MNNKGFTLIEMIGCMALLCFVLFIGIRTSKDAIVAGFSGALKVTTHEVFTAAKTYTIENNTKWINTNSEEYTCLTVRNLVDKGYFSENKVSDVIENNIKIVRNSKTKVIEDTYYVGECK